MVHLDAFHRMMTLMIEIMPVVRLVSALALALSVLALPAAAQTPPSSAELAAYEGLHKAAASGDLAAIKRLATSSGVLEARDANGRTPLHVAGFRGHHAAAKLLLQSEANANALDRQKYDLVTIAAVANDVEMVRVALAGGGLATNITSPYDGTALIAAAHLGHVEPVRLLIAGGAPLDHVNNLGWTALIEAIVLGDGGPRHVAIVQMLVDAGARLDLADRQGRSPLALARERGHADIIRRLEAAGAK